MKSDDVATDRSKGIDDQVPMNILHRFMKPGGHWAEIRVRRVMKFGAIEYVVFVDGSLLGSELFHNDREAEYDKALEARINQFISGGWIAVPDANNPVSN